MTDYDDLSFKVERWSEGYGRREATIARAADSFSAKATFEATVKRRSVQPIVVRQKARVTMKSVDDS
jgi:hypothetical protein